MVEDVQLAELLQKTYSYKGADLNSIINSGFVPDSPYCDFREIRTNPGDDLFAGDLRASISYTAQMNCTFLTWGDGQSSPIGNLCEKLISGGRCVKKGIYCEKYYDQYDCAYGSVCATGACSPEPGHNVDCLLDVGFKCVPKNYQGDADCNNTSAGPECGSSGNYKCLPEISVCNPVNDEYPSTQSCTDDVLVNMKLEDRTPLANKAWTKLVAGSTGIFRKMFPKIGGDNNAFEGIIDMPASTPVSYSNETGGVLYVGNPTSQMSGAGAQLYFPHIGGIKEYFLTGIQTLLRPEGIGVQPVFCKGDECKEANGNPFQTNPVVTPGTSEICSQSCNKNALAMIDGSSLLSPSSPVRFKFNDLATRWWGSGVCSGNPRTDKYDKVVNDAISKGVNPVFALAIWLNESVGSNYLCLCKMEGGSDSSSTYCTKARDFGQNNPDYETLFSVSGNTVTMNRDKFDTQLGLFLGEPKYYLDLCDINNYACEWELFGSIFHYGTQNGACIQQPGASPYIMSIKALYEALAPGLEFPCYPISI